VNRTGKVVAALAGTVAVALAVSLAGCGVPRERQFQPIGADETPIAIGSTPSSVEEADKTAGIAAPRGIYLVNAESLIVRRPRGGITGVAEALELLTSPTPSRQPELRSALQVGDILALHTDSASPARLVLTIDLAPTFLDLPVDEQRLALAQIVLTVTDQAVDVGVSFAIDGSVVNVPRSDSSVSDGPVGRADYVDLLVPS
jgi:hypothetical protein